MPAPASFLPATASPNPTPPSSTPFTPAPARKVSGAPGAQGSWPLLGYPTGPVVHYVGVIGVFTHSDSPFPISPPLGAPH